MERDVGCGVPVVHRVWRDWVRQPTPTTLALLLALGIVESAAATPSAPSLPLRVAAAATAAGLLCWIALEGR